MDENQEGVQSAPDQELAQVESVVENNNETVVEAPNEQVKQEKPKGYIPQHVAQKRFDQLTGKNYELQREIEALRALVAGGEEQHSAKQSYSADDVRRAAAEMLELQQFNSKCDEIYKDGVASYPDFADALKNLAPVGGLPNDRLQVITELPHAHDVVYELANDLDLADRIFSMPQHKQAIELAKLSTKIASDKATKAQQPAAKAVSKAPEPIDPVGKGDKRGASLSEGMSMSEWAAAREKQRSERGLRW